MSYSASPMTTRVLAAAQLSEAVLDQRSSSQLRHNHSRFGGCFVGPLEHHMDADGAVGDAILVGCDQ